MGDQPTAISELVAGVNSGRRSQVLLGVTGSGKTFTMANVIAELGRPALIMAPNKILAAQLYTEMKSFFPNNHVEYFVSYYDYYQPEAYMPTTDTYIDKDASINEQLDRMRHSATRAMLLGSTWSLPADDSSNMTRNEMYEEIVSLLGGRVAEDLFVGDISVGASNDIDRATKLAKDMVARYGMCEKLGTVSYLSGGEVFIGRDYQTTKSYSEAVAATIDEEVKLLIDKAYAHCKQILSDNTEKFHELVQYLLENESMTGEQFAACMEGKEIAETSTTSLFDGFEATEETTAPAEENTDESTES